MTFAEWLALYIKTNNQELSNYSREEINLLRRAFQSGEHNMRQKVASIFAEAGDAETSVQIMRVRLDSG